MELYPTTNDRELARILGLSISFIRSKAEELGLEKEDIEDWTDKEMELLIKLYPDTPNERISEIIGRSKMEIDHYAFRLGLSKSHNFFANIIITEDEKEILDDWEKEYSKKEHGNSKGNFLLGKILKYLFPHSLLHPEYPIGGLRFDFYLPTLTLGFEWDGVQHKEFNSFFYKTKADFVKAQNRDYSKSEMAESLGIAIVRFAHDDDLSIALVRAKIREVA